MKGGSDCCKEANQYFGSIPHNQIETHIKIKSGNTEVPLNKSNKAKHDEKDIPEPDDKVDFINDDIESEDAKSIKSMLSFPRSILVVCTTGNLGQKEMVK